MKNSGQLIERLMPFVKQQLGDDPTVHGPQHALRVAENARKLQAEEGGNLRIILAASLLHDCADHKLFDDTSAQCRLIADFLHQEGFTSEETDAIDDIIRTISFDKGKNPPLQSLEAEIVRDADRLDAIGAIGIIRTIAYGTARQRPFYNASRPDDPDTTLAHFYDKLLLLKDLMHTASGRRLAEERHAFLTTFLDRFYQETGIKR